MVSPESQGVSRVSSGDLGLLIQGEPEVFPVRIGLFDEANFPSAFPALDLVFASFGSLARIMRFIPDEEINFVFAGEGGALAFFVLVCAPGDIVCVSAIERAILAIGEQVDVEGHEGLCERRVSLASFS